MTNKNHQKNYQILKDLANHSSFKNHQQPCPLLGGISIHQFMTEYWQKKPLVIRQAILNYPEQGLIDLLEMLDLAADFALPTRLVQYQKNWQLTQLDPEQIHLENLPQNHENWTILVQKMNTVAPLIQQFMQLFNFLPYARLDDVMISYATPNSGIGAHIDSYDVFLFQGMGQRTWHLSKKVDGKYAELCEDAPLKLLKNFEPEETYVLEAGDMLYLPPAYAHQGVANTEAMTYSVGFRAPRADELIHEYFMEQIAYLDQIKEQNPEMLPATLYADPQQLPTHQPAKTPTHLVEFLEQRLNALKKMTASELLGVYLTRPAFNPNIPLHQTDEAEIDEIDNKNINDDVEHIMPPKEFGKQKTYYLSYDAQMLYDDDNLYLNGETYAWLDLQNQCELSKDDLIHIEQLANQRSLENNQLSNYTKRLLYAWYQDGLIIF